MNATDYSKFALKNGSSIARSTMIAGNYIGRKENEDLRIIGEVETGKWKEIDNPDDSVLRHLAFSTVTDMKNNIPVSVSVPSTFKQLAVKSVFPFKVNEKGYTEITLKKLSDSEVKAMLSDEA